MNDFQLQVGINALLLAMLAVGLNVSVGWAGLLDLGYIAFYGFGAYGFALLSSTSSARTADHISSALVSVPIVMVAAAVLGLLVGLPSRRLIGDYLAIVTLFFGEAFVEFTTNVAPSKLGGPNGIVGDRPATRRSAIADHDEQAATSTCCSSCSCSPSRCCTCSTPRARAGRGAPCATTRSPPG